MPLRNAIVIALVSCLFDGFNTNGLCDDEAMPSGAIARLLNPDEDDSFAAIYLVAYSPDGKLLATRDSDYFIHIWDVASKKKVLSLEGHEFRPLAICFSADSKRIISAAEGAGAKLIVWDIETGKQLHTIANGARFLQREQSGGITMLGSLQSGVLNDETGKIEKKLPTVSLPLAVSTNTQQLAQFAKGSRASFLSISSVNSANVKLRLPPIGSAPTAAAFSNNGELMAASGRGSETIAVYQLSGAPRRFDLNGHDAQVHALTFSPDGRFLASASWDRTICIWDTLTWTVAGVLKGHTANVVTVAFSPDSQFIASGASAPDSSTILWSLRKSILKTELTSAEMSAIGFETFWTSLQNEDARDALGSVGVLASAPEFSLPHLREKLKILVTSATEEEIAQLILDLDNDDFRVREAATDRLTELRPAVDKQLKAAMKNASIEAQFRLERALLSKLPGEVLETEDHRRLLRVIHALELMNESGKELLQAFVNSHPNKEIAAAAKFSLERLK